MTRSFSWCARITSSRSIFAGFSAEALRDRIVDAECRIVLTANEGLRRGKAIPLKQTVDAATSDTCLYTGLVARRTDTAVDMQEGRTLWLAAELAIGVLAIFIARSVLKRPFEGMRRVVGVIFFAGLSGATAGWLVGEVIGGLPGLGLGAVIGVLGSLALLLVLDRRYDFGLLSNLGKAFPGMATRIGL